MSLVQVHIIELVSMTCRSFVSSYHLPKPHTSDQPPSGSSEMDHHEALCWGSAKDSYACWGPSPKHDHCIMQSSPESAISNVLAPARQQSHQRNSWSRSFHGAFPRPWLWHPKEPSEGQQKSPPISHQSLHSPWTNWGYINTINCDLWIIRIYHTGLFQMHWCHPSPFLWEPGQCAPSLRHWHWSSPYASA